MIPKIIASKLVSGKQNRSPQTKLAAAIPLLCGPVEFASTSCMETSCTILQIACRFSTGLSQLPRSIVLSVCDGITNSSSPRVLPPRLRVLAVQFLRI
jgi:hypothetical protein